MDENDAPKQGVFFPLPYSMVVQGEASVRPKEDFWRFRVITNVLRGTPPQIKSFKERYPDTPNL